ncbi:MAG: hypothetical protein ACYDGR_17315, partial [Candidatus Dormibacteria bacterium]
RPTPVMGAVAETIELWLTQDLGQPRKQRHTAHRIYERLVAEHGFGGSESTVRQWVRNHRPRAITRVTIPLAHDPGAEAQIVGTSQESSFEGLAKGRGRFVLQAPPW